MNWTSLWGLIGGVTQHSTVLGRVWFSLVLIFRLLIFVVVAQQVWNDETTQFICNTAQPGCRNVCYDTMFPVSPARLWALQLIAIICPSLMVSAHIKYRQEKDKRFSAANRGVHLYANPTKKRRGLWWTYLFSLFLKAGFDIGFLYVFFHIYRYNIPQLYPCSLEPCPNTVDCFISRPTEKKVFIIFMAVSSVVCILLCLCEICYLMCRCCWNWERILSRRAEGHDPTVTAETQLATQQQASGKLIFQHNDIVTEHDSSTSKKL
ncbi:gap junction beta-7 protein-like [Paramormyrops kingsleyae]|uniref:gap junction beta-7 protein-like n=1 Tax=Paramormyrops kingsleyae TaxID=1676925 RepID=UPI003B96B4F0